MKAVTACASVSHMKLSAQDFQSLGTAHEIDPLPRVGIAALFALAVTVTIIRPGAIFGALLLLVFLIGAVALWLKFVRVKGIRMNNYDPMKSDVELQRTQTNWKEEWRPLLMVLVGFAVINVGSMFRGPLPGIGLGVITFAVFYWLLGAKTSRPAYYKLPEDLVRESQRADEPWAEGPDALLAAMYALRLVPGGYQQHNTELLERLENLFGWKQEDMQKALKELTASGEVVNIRELRSRDHSVVWLTVTSKASHQFQQRVKSGSPSRSAA